MASAANQSAQLSSQGKSRRLLLTIALSLFFFAQVDVDAHAKIIGINWYYDVDGLRTARSIAQGFQEPIFIYYRDKNCGWCNRVESLYLRNPDVKEFLSRFAKVTIDVSSKDNNRLYANNNQISKFPALIVSVPHASTETIPIEPFRQSRPASAGQFIQALRQAVATLYSNAALAALQANEFERAEQLQLKSTQYLPALQSELALARIYEQWANATASSIYYHNAKHYYQRILESDPQHAESAAGLRRLRQIKNQ